MSNEIEATMIMPGLYQGSRAQRGHSLRLAGFSVVVLTAQEYQPSDEDFPGLTVMRVPYDDADEMPSEHTLRALVKTAERLARRIRGGQRVLVTCQAGLNRSGLLTALTMHRLTGWPGINIVSYIRSRRFGALSNPTYAKIAQRLRPHDSPPFVISG